MEVFRVAMALSSLAGDFTDNIASMAKLASKEGRCVLNNPTMGGGVGAWRPEQHIATAGL
ncbi:hypothetical protein DPPLL_00430 [Desulfofustis limnaeus]|jgi:hypothetical protein|uniref:Uncharacterized protein n=1 Tax=Desulfofustis limnaeus TaxID=2740163 RepID=A0ABM7W436_9BACT|nr:hypothetical protein DPPLL_00430 [Desulfofustis limnaeus]